MRIMFDTHRGQNVTHVLYDVDGNKTQRLGEQSMTPTCTFFQ